MNVEGTITLLNAERTIKRLTAERTITLMSIECTITLLNANRTINWSNAERMLTSSNAERTVRGRPAGLRTTERSNPIHPTWIWILRRGTEVRRKTACSKQARTTRSRLLGRGNISRRMKDLHWEDSQAGRRIHRHDGGFTRS
eukprot:1193773-Prorocentrum_minimum.AAC.2